MDSSLLAVYQELRSDWSAREPAASSMGALGRAAWSEWATEGDAFGLELPYPTWAKAVTADLVKVGPKGYIHGWIKVGAGGAVGDLVHHPEHGHGKVTRVGSKTVGVQFHSGAYHAFEHGGVGEGHFVPRVGRAAKPAAGAPQEDVVGRVAQDLGMGQGHAYSSDAKALLFARGELADGATPTEAADRLERFILGPDGNSYLHHNVPSEERDAARQQWRDLAGRLRQADVPGRTAKPATPKRQPLPGLRMNKLEHGDHIVWESPGEAPVHGTVRREGKGKRTHIDWDNGRSEPVSRAGREPNMRMATDEERAERAATGENPNDRATRLAMHAEGSTLDPAVYRRALVAPITEAAAALATDAHNGASPRAVAHRVRTAHNRHRDIVDRMGWADRFDDIAATAESGDVAGAQQRMGDLAAAADVRLGAMPGDVVPFGDDHEPLGEIRAGAPAQVHRPATYFTAGGREYLHEQGQVMPAPTGAGHGRDLTTDHAIAVAAFNAGKDEHGQWDPVGGGGIGSKRGGRHSETEGGYQGHLAIARVQGFDGLPTVLTRDHVDGEWRRLKAEGATPLYRGFGWGTDKPGTEMAHEFLYGPLHAGGGIGMGTNFSTDLAAADHYASADRYTRLPGGKTIGVLLRPEARVIRYPEAVRQRDEFLAGLPADKEYDAERKLYEDPGTFAAAKGYDAMVATKDENPVVKRGTEEWVVFNRSALVAWDDDPAPSSRMQAEALHVEAAARQRALDAGLPAAGATSRRHHVPAGPVGTGHGATAAGWEQRIAEQQQVDEMRARAEQVAATPVSAPEVTRAAEDRILAMDRPGAPAHIRETAAGIRERRTSEEAPELRTRITIAPRGRMPAALRPPSAPRPAATPKPPKLPPAEAAQQALSHIRAGGQTDATLKALPVAALRELARLHGIVGSLGGRDDVKRMRKPDLIREMTPWFS